MSEGGTLNIEHSLSDKVSVIKWIPGVKAAAKLIYVLQDRLHVDNKVKIIKN